MTIQKKSHRPNTPILHIFREMYGFYCDHQKIIRDTIIFSMAIISLVTAGLTYIASTTISPFVKRIDAIELTDQSIKSTLGDFKNSIDKLSDSITSSNPNSINSRLSRIEGRLDR